MSVYSFKFLNSFFSETVEVVLLEILLGYRNTVLYFFVGVFFCLVAMAVERSIDMYWGWMKRFDLNLTVLFLGCSSTYTTTSL